MGGKERREGGGGEKRIQRERKMKRRGEGEGRGREEGGRKEENISTLINTCRHTGQPLKPKLNYVPAPTWFSNDPQARELLTTEISCQILID